MKQAKTVFLALIRKYFNDKVYKATFVLLLVSLSSIKSFGQISILTLPYVPGTTNFNTYNPSSTANLTATIPAGWSASTAGTAVYNAQGNGTNGTAGYWALGTGGEFCLGSVPSGASDNITYTVSFTNNSGSTITTLAISWDYEQWRFNGNSDMLVTGTGALIANASLNAQDYNDVAGTSGTVATTNISIVLTGLNITNGTAFGITWVSPNTGSTASDNGIGIDNFSITASRTNLSDHFRTRQTGNWNASSTWESSVDAITWVNSNASPDFNANTITVRNGHTATVTSSVSVDQTSINTGGQITINAGQSLTIPDGTGTDLTVDGTVINNGIVSQTGTAVFNANSLYTHGINGGVVPTATWSTTSTCNITGVINTPPTGLNQSFGNFTWNCPGHSTLINLNSQLQTINGNFTVLNGGQATGRTTSNGLALSTNTDFTLNIGRNFSIDHTGSNATWLMMTNGTANVTINVGGDFNISKTSVVNNTNTYFDYKAVSSTAMGTLVVNVTGNLTMIGGYLDMGYQASSYSVGTELRLNGNLSVSATSTLITSGSNIVNGTIIFNRAGNQTMFEGAAVVTAYVNYRVNSGSRTELLSNYYLYDYITAIKSGNFTVLSGGILDMNTYILHGYSVAGNSINVLNTYTFFTLNSGAGIITAKPEGVHQIGFINGSISAAIAARTFSSAANYTYDGSVTQNSGTFLTTPVANQVNNLTINNTSGNTTGVTLQQPIAVAGTCTFNNGLLTTSSTNLLTINDNAIVTLSDNSYLNSSYANGPVKKIGNEAFTFPVGKLGWGYHLLSISAPLNSTDEFTCEYLRANARLLGPVSFPLTRVSQCEYWSLVKNSTAPANINVILSWTRLSPCGPAYVSRPADLRVAWFQGPTWISAGYLPPFTGDEFDGTISSTPVSNFGYFSLASIDVQENVLPTALFDLQLQKNKEGISVNWKNTKEEKVAYYQVMRSTNGKDFIPVAVINATQNNGNEARYTFIDKSATQALYYYRIKLMNIENDQFYSNTAKMNLESRGGSLNILSNPVTDHRLGLQLNDLPAGIYNLTLINSSGQVVYKNNINHISGSATYAIQLSSSLTKGVYYLQVNTADNKFTKSILIQ